MTRVETDSSYWNYGYDRLGQVTNGWRFWPGGSNVLGQTFNYQFDDIGNRRIAQTGGNRLGEDLRTATYSANLLNQYTNRTVPGVIEVSGAAEASATVTINGNPAERQDDYFRHELLADNSTGATSVWLTATATNATATNLVARLEHLPQTPESFTYDADGNLTSDGLRIYTWDAENRLLAAEIRTNIVTDARHWLRVTFDYDHQHRRIRKRAWKWNPAGETYYLSTSHRFFYDDWNLIGQIDEVIGDRMSFLWGADLSGTLRGAGGVGGLVAVMVHTGVQPGSYFSNYDHNGNVVALIDSQSGNESARYEYGPFGEEIRATGILAKENPFRFSSKYYDEETGLTYYGYRYYSASLGRWINPDPLGELSDPNLYRFNYNSPGAYLDPNGLSGLSVIAPPTWAGPYLNSPIGLGGTAGATASGVTLGAAVAWGLPTAIVGGAIGYGIGKLPTGNGENVHERLGGWLAPLFLNDDDGGFAENPFPKRGAILKNGEWVDAQGNVRNASGEIIRDKYGRIIRIDCERRAREAVANGLASPIPEAYFNPKYFVDMEAARGLNGSTLNSFGEVRNADYFWRELLTREPEMFTEGNRYRILELGLSPTVNATWIQFNPTHGSYLGEVLHHHHVNQGPIAVPLPKTVHEAWSSKLHNRE